MGATMNYLNKKLADELKLEKTQINIEQRIVVANGEDVKCDTQYITDVSFAKFLLCSFKIELWELNNLPIDINIGIQWLANNREIINPSSNLITLDNKAAEIELDKNTSINEFIFDCVQICHSKNQVMDKINRMKTIEYREVGTIRGITHAIVLTESTSLFKRPYSAL